MTTLKRFCTDESGATAIEYGLLAALLSITVVFGAGMSGQEMARLYNTVGTTISNAIERSS